MNLDQLLHFARVAEYGSFTRAALSLDMSQPAISRSIRQLEVELRRNLFHRHGRGIHLTDEGHRLRALVAKIFEQVDEARDIFTGDSSRLTGRVTVGLPPTLGRILAVPLVQAFQAEFPLARLSIVEGLSRVLVDRMLGDRVDIALLYDPPPSSSLQVQPLCTQSLYLLSARETVGAQAPQSVAFSALPQQRLILPSQPNPIRMLVEAEATRKGLSFEVGYEVDGVEAILRLVEKGVGQTIGTLAMIRDSGAHESIVAQRIVDPAIDCVVSFVTPQRGPRNQLQTQTLELLQALTQRALLEPVRG
ncbi:LysR substrate-binding domain-containing protein [Xenophilus arseniciresistens]|uniref:LysR substrate-binding domain-containing protein n=1 Tax=Xenophilus arseniciresistens TaxID=1283306 RepID=A0AAE3T0Y2_9BURK|nr:LysR substrate-binding domain-containing protein [Xenophilus arseniciresistens]MDA7418624.1 LysR substrate-binding domain-containing protein [Xenophilus arseniciresistens]